MLKLSDYIGQVLTDVATGREIADKNSAALSERYQADSFMKGMPVPHYTIEQASFDLPFMIVGVITQGNMDTDVAEQILAVTRDRIEILIYSFLYEKHKAQASAEGKPEESLKNLRKKYKESIDGIINTVVRNVKTSIEEEGLKILKLLDLVDSLCTNLSALLEKESASFEDGSIFSNQENIIQLINKCRRVLFNEYKEIISTTNGVIIDASTGKLNEYAEDGCLTHIKVTLKEQDLDFIVEQDEKSGAMKRFLSLN